MSFTPETHLQTSQTYTASPIVFTVVGILDIASSKLLQVDKWRDYEDPHKASVDRLNKGRNHIIRELRDDNEDAGISVIPTGSSLYKLTLKDGADNYCFAYEYMEKLPFLRQARNASGSASASGDNTDSPLPIPLGSKIRVEKGTLIMNGVLMLTRVQCLYLGVTEEDQELYAKLNLDIAKKYIQYLTGEINMQK